MEWFAVVEVALYMIHFLVVVDLHVAMQACCQEELGELNNTGEMSPHIADWSPMTCTVFLSMFACSSSLLLAASAATVAVKLRLQFISTMNVDT
jgi:hypothetical protein